MNTTKDDGQAFCDALGYKSQFGAHSPGKSLLRTLDATYEQVRETLRQLPCAVEGWEDSPGSAYRVRLENGGSLLLIKNAPFPECFLYMYPGSEKLCQYRDITLKYQPDMATGPVEKLAAWVEARDGSPG